MNNQLRWNRMNKPSWSNDKSIFTAIKFILGRKKLLYAIIENTGSQYENWETSGSI